MPKISAGILCYRIKDHVFEVLLAHPGGPFWKNKDVGAWSIPKGEPNENEPLLDAAKREFKEETGITVNGDFIALAPVKQKGHKEVYAFAVAFDADVTNIISNQISIEWPPRSNKKITIPEIDKAEWFNIIDAAEKINKVQANLIDELLQKLYNLSIEQIEKVKMLGNFIKQKSVIRFNYTSHKTGKASNTFWRKIEPYMVGKYMVENTHLSLSGYFISGLNKEDSERPGQRNYKVDSINPNEIELLNETFDDVKVPIENLTRTPNMVIFYRALLKTS